MPVQPIQWMPPNKPIWKLKDLLAKHKSEQNWTEVVVNDNLFTNVNFGRSLNNTDGSFSLPATGNLADDWGPAAFDVRRSCKASSPRSDGREILHGRQDHLRDP